MTAGLTTESKDCERLEREIAELLAAIGLYQSALDAARKRRAGIEAELACAKAERDAWKTMFLERCPQ